MRTGKDRGAPKALHAPKAEAGSKRPGVLGAAPRDGQPSRGRPARISLDAIVQAAAEIGFDQFTLASRLDVTVGAIYRYVQSRDELLLLVAQRTDVDSPPIPSSACHWATTLLDACETTYTFYCRSPSGLERFVGGAFGPHVRVPQRQRTSETLVSQGFSFAEAVALNDAASFVGAGAAINQMHIQSLEASGRAYSDILKDAIAETANQDFFGEDMIEYLRGDDWRPSMRLLLESVASARGQLLPDEVRARL
jgi:AcrR family transcriptional regulator